MSTVLVTGATGFIGQKCLTGLDGKYEEIHAVCRGIPKPSGGSVHWHSTDLFDESRVSQLVREVRPTHLLHLAWITNPGEYWNSVENARWLLASAHLVHQFALQGGKRIAVAGSCAEYDWS